MPQATARAASPSGALAEPDDCSEADFPAVFSANLLGRLRRKAEEKQTSRSRIAHSAGKAVLLWKKLGKEIQAGLPGQPDHAFNVERLGKEID